MKKSFIHQQKEISFVKTTFTQYLKDKLDIIEVQGPILSETGCRITFLGLNIRYL